MSKETTQIGLEDILLHADKTAQEQLDVMNAQLEAQANTMQSLDQIFSSLNSIKDIKITGVKGDKGDKGDTGSKGERGDKGEAGKDGKDGINGKDGETISEKEIIEIIKPLIPEPIKGKDGISPDIKELLKKVVVNWDDIKDKPDYERYLKNISSKTYAIREMEDVSFNNLTPNDVIKWDGQKWINGTGGGGSGTVTSLTATAPIVVDLTNPAIPRVGITTDTIFHPISPTSSSYLYASRPLSATSGAEKNTAYGVGAGTNITTAQQNNLFGWNSGNSITSGLFNNIFAINSLTALTSGANNTVVGINIGNGANYNNMIAFGSGIFTETTTFSLSTGIGVNLANAIGDVVSSTTLIGREIATGGSSNLNSNLIIGDYIGAGATLDVTSSIIQGRVLFSGGATVNNSFIIANGSFNAAGTSLLGDFMAGSNLFTGAPFTSGGNNYFISDNVGYNSTTPTATQTTVIGSTNLAAMDSVTGAVIVGTNIGNAISDSSDSIMLGSYVANAATIVNNSILQGVNTVTSLTGLVSDAIVIGAQALKTVATDITATTAVGYNIATSISNSLTNSAIFGSGQLSSSTATDLDRIFALGVDSGGNTSTNSNIILLGAQAQPSSGSSTNEMAVGSQTYPITRYWLGNGGFVANAQANAITISPTESDGTNISGVNFTVTAGNGSGTGGSGSFVVQTAAPGSTGFARNTMSDALSVDKNGNIRAYRVHNNATAQGGITQQDIRSGTYTPTLTNVTNLAASTAFKCQWLRVGNVVTVSGKVSMDATIAGATELQMSLPIASNLTAEEDLCGTATSSAVANLNSTILGNAANDRASFKYVATNLANNSYFFSFTYEVI